MGGASIARRIGRGLMVLMLAVSVGSLTSPGTAYAKQAMAWILRWASSAVRWPEPPLRPQRHLDTTQCRRPIPIPTRREFTQLRLRHSILTRRRPLCILRCPTTGRDFTTAATEGGLSRPRYVYWRRCPAGNVTGLGARDYPNLR